MDQSVSFTRYKVNNCGVVQYLQDLLGIIRGIVLNVAIPTNPLSKYCNLEQMQGVVLQEHFLLLLLLIAS